MKSLLNKTVFITDKDSIYYDEWGTIVHQDEDEYYIAIANGTDSVPIFNRNQFCIKKSKTQNN